MNHPENQFGQADETFELAHEGRFCCAGGECDPPSFLLEEGGL